MHVPVSVVAVVIAMMMVMAAMMPAYNPVALISAVCVSFALLVVMIRNCTTNYGACNHRTTIFAMLGVRVTNINSRHYRNSNSQC